MVDEGLNLVRAVRARHDGARRNPWDEFECGHHYARALASWSVLLALSGYQYSAPERRLRFVPRVSQERFRCFFSAGDGWGVYRQRRTGGAQTHTLTLNEGRLALRTLEVAAPAAAVRIAVHGAGAALGPSMEPLRGGLARIDFGREVTLEAGRRLTVRLVPQAA
jgi:hypothetical protein